MVNKLNSRAVAKKALLKQPTNAQEHLKVLQHQLRRQRLEIEALQHRIEMKEQQVASQQTDYEVRVSELVKHNEELEVNITERFSELAIITRHAEHLLRSLQHREQQLQQAKNRVHKLKKTASWKLTTPIRALGRALKDAPKTKSLNMKNIEYIATSGLFDEVWYQNSYPEVKESGLCAIEHYIKIGANKGYNPSVLFDTNWYLTNYEDVVQSAINPLLHYILYGKAEQRHCLSDNMR